MYLKNISFVLSTLVLLGVFQASRSEQLVCYVCDDCLKVDENTHTDLCDESFFNSEGSTPTTITTTTETTSTEITTTTEEEEETTTTTEGVPTPPTPPTVGPSTLYPTPPTQGTIPTIANEAFVDTTAVIPANSPKFETTSKQPEELDFVLMSNQTAALNQTTKLNNISAVEISTPLATVSSSTVQESSTNAMIAKRQRRSSYYGPSYHCYAVKVVGENNTVHTNRGCSRVQPNEGVCEQLNTSINATGLVMRKCTPCTSQLCNTGTTLKLSVTAILVLVLATFVRGS